MDRDRWGHDQPEPADAGSDSDSEYEEITTTTRTVKKTTYNPKPLVEALRSKVTLGPAGGPDGAVWPPPPTCRGWTSVRLCTAAVTCH